MKRSLLTLLTSLVMAPAGLHALADPVRVEQGLLSGVNKAGLDFFDSYYLWLKPSATASGSSTTK